MDLILRKKLTHGNSSKIRLFFFDFHRFHVRLTHYTVRARCCDRRCRDVGWLVSSWSRSCTVLSKQCVL